MKTAGQDHLLAEYLLDGLQTTYPQVLSYERKYTDGMWSITLQVVDDEGRDYFRYSQSYLSPFTAAEEAVRMFLNDQPEDDPLAHD